jgi:regulator of cell morphogenesis and NO signaling
MVIFCPAQMLLSLEFWITAFEREIDLIREKQETIMILSSDRTVRDVALELPQATRVFEKLKIDYCCRGDMPLGEACRTAGVDVENLTRMLEEAGQAEVQRSGMIDFQKATLGELIGHILDKHHVYTKDEMARLEPLIDKVIGAHGGNHPELQGVGGLFQKLCADLKPHMFKEEQILFPYILDMEMSALQNKPAPVAPFGTVNNPVRMMMMEHDAVGELLRELRALSSDYTVPANGCISYQTLYQALEAFEQDLHQHIHLENNILFPRAIEMEANGASASQV